MNNAWQPIETAPKDGESILVYAGGDMYIVRWIEYPAHGGWFVDVSNHYPFALRGQTPTYWQPLPPAPENA